MPGRREGPLRVAIVTPAVNRRGGTEKALAWVVEDLSRTCDLTLIVRDVEETDVGGCRVVRVPGPRRPRVVAFIVFLIASTAIVTWLRFIGRRFDTVLATSGDCLVPDVVYAHFCCAAWLEQIATGQVELPAVSVRQRIRNVHYRVFLRLASRVERAIYRRSELRAVAAVSAGLRQELVKHYNVGINRVAIVPNAVDERVMIKDAERFTVRERTRSRLGIAADKVAILFIAAGDWERKGLALILEALAIMSSEAAFLMVVGEDDIEHYGRYAQQLHISERVHYTGFVTDPQSFYAAADIFAYPSAYEAFSLVSLEAAGAGLPLVMTRINGSEELLVDGENGILVGRDPSSLSAALVRLVSDKPLRERMGSEARRTSTRFTRERTAEAIMHLCQVDAAPEPTSAARR